MKVIAAILGLLLLAGCSDKTPNAPEPPSLSVCENGYESDQEFTNPADLAYVCTMRAPDSPFADLAGEDVELLGIADQSCELLRLNDGDWESAAMYLYESGSFTPEEAGYLMGVASEYCLTTQG